MGKFFPGKVLIHLITHRTKIRILCNEILASQLKSFLEIYIAFWTYRNYWKSDSNLKGQFLAMKSFWWLILLFDPLKLLEIRFKFDIWQKFPISWLQFLSNEICKILWTLIRVFSISGPKSLFTHYVIYEWHLNYYTENLQLFLILDALRLERFTSPTLINFFGKTFFVSLLSINQSQL